MTSTIAIDSAVMLRRNLKHVLRSPDSMITAIALPVMLMLLFVYVFGGAINTGDAVDIAGFGVVAENRRNTARTLRQAHLVSIGSLQVANRVELARYAIEHGLDTPAVE